MHLDDCLKIADKVVAVNSSVIFDALIHEKPVLALGTSILSGKNILFEYKPNKTKEVLSDFLNSVNFQEKIKNFNSFLEYMFRENLIFLKNEEDILKFSKKIMKFKVESKNLSKITDENRILEKYSRNIKKENIDRELNILLYLIRENQKDKFYFQKIKIE